MSKPKVHHMREVELEAYQKRLQTAFRDGKQEMQRQKNHRRLAFFCMIVAVAVPVYFLGYKFGNYVFGSFVGIVLLGIVCWYFDKTYIHLTSHTPEDYQ